MSQEILIDFENVTSEVYHKNTIWDIQDNEKIGLIEFIEEHIMHKVKIMLDEKDRMIETLETKIIKLNDNYNNIQNYLNRLSNLQVNISKTNPPIFHKLDTKEIILDSANFVNLNEIFWEQIECFICLNKLTIISSYGENGRQHIRINDKIFRRIKSQNVKELIIFPSDDKFYDSIPIILTNMPNLNVLEIIHVYNLHLISNMLSLNPHKIKIIRLKRVVDKNFDVITEYCIRENIELIIS